jgi:hypothetical protein
VLASRDIRDNEGATLRTLRAALILGAILAGSAAVTAGPAAARSLPTIYTTINSKGDGVYKVRPHKIILTEAAGGNIVLTWFTWTSSSATGSGTATSSGMGTTTTFNLTVKATRVKHGTFTRLTIQDTSATEPPEKLVLTSSGWTPAPH